MSTSAQRRASRAEGTTGTLSRLREALAWYADPDHYQEHRRPLASGGVSITPPAVLTDRGQRARAALAAQDVEPHEGAGE